MFDNELIEEYNRIFGTDYWYFTFFGRLLVSLKTLWVFLIYINDIIPTNEIKLTNIIIRITNIR